MTTGLRITGSGHYLPGPPIDNHALARVMDTSDEWIRQRTGIESRHFCPEGQGASDLALPAAQRALESAGIAPEDLDYVLFNTMTPDYLFPGSAPVLADRLGCIGVPALDLRAQCAAMIYSFQLANALIASGEAERVLVVGAEAHAGFMPWRDWDILAGERNAAPSPEDRERATRHRALAIIFGDGAGALVLERSPRPGCGILALDVHTDGRFVKKLYIPAGFRTRPFISERTVQEDTWIPSMDGRDVFRQAVTLLPQSVRRVCHKAGVTLEQVDWFIAHQANQRINDAVRERLGVPEHKVPSNIARLGNTSAATIAILVDEMRRDGRLRDGQLVCFLALGAGVHWGSVLMRV